MPNQTRDHPVCSKHFLVRLFLAPYLNDFSCSVHAAFASREMLLPDIGMVHGRTIVAAWDYGLDKVEDNAVRLVMKAVEVGASFKM